MGIVLVLLAAGVIIALWKRRALLGLCLALAIPLVYLGEFELNLPIVSFAGGRQAENITAAYGPVDAAQTLILFAHYDSKTEIFDHRRRKPIYAAAPAAMILLILAALLCFPTGRSGSLLARALRRFGLVLAGLGAAGLLLLAFSFTAGLFSPPSPGARDDGTAVAILLGVADALNRGAVQTNGQQIRLAFFAGEEANLQGSQAYVRRHHREMGRTLMLNLECLSGAGRYCYNDRSGTFLRKYAASPEMVAMLNRALAAKGHPAAHAGEAGINDAASFAAAGIPAVTIYQAVPGQDDSYHNAGDVLAHVVPGRMEETVGILCELIKAGGG